MLARQALIVTSARQMPDGAVKPAVRSGVLRQVLHSGVPRPCLAVVLRAFEGGGAQRDIILLCNALAAKGVNVTVLALHQDGPLRSLLDPAVCVTAIPGRQLRYAIPGLRHVIRHIEPAVVVSSEAGLNLCTLIAVRSMPRRHRPKLILREVGSPSIAQHRDPYRSNRIAYRILRLLYRRADRIVTLTEGARRDLEQNFAVPEAMIAVMGANAVIPPAMAERLRRRDGETGREPDLIVSVGRLSPEKDHRTLLRAMTLLPADCRYRLAIVGQGSERAALEKLARAYGLAERVIFVGQVPDPFVWMMRARLAICSSIYEGLCNAVIEALACGTPVVSTDCPYGPREILQGGRYGTLTPIGDAAAMANAIAGAMQRIPDRQALIDRGMQYTAAAAAERFLEIIADLHPAPFAVQRMLAAE
jgi:glycosyltransferase involved in cell wall biosynthesis